MECSERELVILAQEVIEQQPEKPIYAYKPKQMEAMITH
jgi:hypothetical protein